MKISWKNNVCNVSYTFIALLVLANLAFLLNEAPLKSSDVEDCKFVSTLGDEILIPSRFVNMISSYQESFDTFSKYLELTHIHGQPKGHARFFPLSPLVTCRNITSVGGSKSDDESKLICGINKLTKGCVIYSIGGNNQWKFELDLLAKTPCAIHTFDCTGSPDRFKVPDARIHFHHICLGVEHEAEPTICIDGEKCGVVMTLNEILAHLNHSNIDILKMDIEGFEVPILNSWNSMNSIPSQMVIEFHYLSQFKETLDKAHEKFGLHSESGFEIAFAHDFWKLTTHLISLNLFPIIRNDNIYCSHCTEITLLSIKSKCAYWARNNLR